ncbi:MULTISPECIES: hypothetical protein [Bradyrhizobium]|uniref:hypothetical protein n=1 Tax=Bradyrhizobium TaxID=374 RepID=UPI0002FB1AC9|nr:hypothetical protein [Bradyrhizobium japonicum]MCS3534986.1 hypothetical protein [Bradyrhizobium japonicum]MCS3988917.1 hypothetical protein [Bradyrhizobium japonicum]MCS4016267.1 hypothetical protein [Bradyrhizobium japonicum]MCS4203362.1 hypothetical protein [Bradyrhizobium japonicum]MDH6178037.1 hypothetical protein [Bradyrhizobium japonicum]
MPFSELRKAAASVEDHAVEEVELRPIPPEFEGPRVPAPRDPDYVHSVFYDPQRFETFPDRLLEKVRREFPGQPLWQPEPVHVASLHGWMATYSWSHTEKFLRDGYVAELEAPRFKSGPDQTRSLRSKQAWDAFLVNASFTEAIADALWECRPHYRLNWVFGYPHTNALAPIVGKVDDTYRRTRAVDDLVDTEPGTTILCKKGTLLVGPRAILNRRRNGSPTAIAYPADPVTLTTASNGRSLYSGWTSNTRREILKRVKQEVRAWCEAGFNPEAFLIWVLQTVAILRVQATDWKGRERPAYVQGDADAKRRDDAAELDLKLTESGLQRGDDCPIEVRRAPVTARADVISMLAGGIGLEDEAIWRDNEVLRANLARQDIGSLAAWIGRLKRFHRETLSPWHARLIEEILTDTPVSLNELEMTGDDWSAPHLIRAQFPDDVWRGLVDAALYSERGETDVEVSYDWNDDPLQQAAILLNEGERNEEKVAITGPLLDLSARRRGWWSEQLEEFRQAGSLTI